MQWNLWNVVGLPLAKELTLDQADGEHREGILPAAYTCGVSPARTGCDCELRILAGTAES